MFSEDSYSPPLMISGLGHVPEQATTVSPADLYLTQHSHGPTQSSAIPHLVASAVQSFVGHSAVYNAPQGAPGYNPLARVAQPMGHASRQFSILNDVPAGYFGGHPMPVGQMSRGSSRGCEWISEDWSTTCGQTITEVTAPKHLAAHGIKNMRKDHIVRCRWQGCLVHIKRESIVRHVREAHLGSKRKHPFPRPVGLTLE
ncbi:hypothetical protein OG21DRAFT_130168 [Imleria badia]|nr:hypothetical protein OG21DRAFT_130168 [Imleria badia]